ncbi:MAG: SDR family NAD(P)-dependent oxidoreductase [Nitriliruptorales bacterium]|nr:SDR family NAD(P)-dependent oxidoreductase [Nitriliruptorales bacterium]
MSAVTHNSIAVVTGAGSGIGRAMALELARRRSSVVCADIDGDRAAETAAMIGDDTEALALTCDVTRLEEVETLAATTIEHFGHVEIIVNNAGIGAGGAPIGETSIADWHRVVDVNLWGVIHGCHVFTPMLREVGRGGVLNVASAASFGSAAGMAAYNVTKSGVVSLSETLAAEVTGTGINVSVLCPTFVKTNIVLDGQIDSETRQIAQRLLELTGRSADRVARIALDGLDAGRLYVMPQLEAKAAWRFKRLAPNAYLAGTRAVGRLGLGVGRRSG